MIQFTNPSLLWSLLGLAIPIGIHLLSRKEGKLIKLGSLRHVHETSTQQFKGLRLNEVLLLVLRCALVVLFAFLISGFSIASEGTSKWLVLERGLSSQPRVRQLTDSLASNGYEIHMLASGFPLLEDSASKSSEVNYRKLADDLSGERIASAIVLSANRVVDFDGLQNALPPNIKWISQAGQKNSFALQAIKKGDSIVVRHGFSNANQTYFTTNTGTDAGTATITDPPKISVALVADDKYTYDKAIVKAALRAIDESFQVQIEIKDFSKEGFEGGNYDWVVWLSDQAPEEQSARTLTLTPRQSSKLIEQASANRWILTSRLNEEVALKHNLTVQLALLIVPGRMELEQLSEVNDRRLLPDSLAWSSTKSITQDAGMIPEPGNKYVLVLLLILLATERILASARNQ